MGGEVKCYSCAVIVFTSSITLHYESSSDYNVFTTSVGTLEFWSMILKLKK